MRIQIASDLHMEFPENRRWLKHNPIIPEGELLLLAGDIVSDKHKKKAGFFFKDVESKFQRIIMINGNHEFYEGTISYAYPKYFKKLNDKRFKLNNFVYVADEFRIIASTLWSFIPSINRQEYYKLMNDYRYIFKQDQYDKIQISIEDTNLFHKISVDFILTELGKDFSGKTIVMTHHIPSLDILLKIPGFKALYAYGSNLKNIINNHKIDLWIFGHYHKSFNEIVGKTRLVSNPLGYIEDGRNPEFKRDYVINL